MQASTAPSPLRPRDGLAAEVCHDLDNVLLSLGAHAASLRSCLAASVSATAGRRAAGHLDAIETALDFLRRRSRRLRESSRAATPRSSTVDLRDWWRGVERCIRASLPERVRLRAHLPETLPPVRIAADELTACVMHLVVNAGQAIPPGRTDGEATIDASADGEHVVRLSVSDNGVGMPPRCKRLAGTPGFTTRPDGTGLGLHAVRGMIERAGGTMRIRSTPGRGSSVELHLPADTLAMEGLP